MRENLVYWFTIDVLTDHTPMCTGDAQDLLSIINPKDRNIIESILSEVVSFDPNGNYYKRLKVFMLSGAKIYGR